MNMKTFPRTMAAIALMTTTFVGVVHAGDSGATPFGIEIGGSCDHALTKLGETTSKKVEGEGGDLVHYAVKPGALFVGAKELSVHCSVGMVTSLQLVAPKGGGNHSAKDAYATLSKLYKRIEGGPIPSVGNGYALFRKGDSIIEMSAPHLRSDFKLTYFMKEVYDHYVDIIQKEEQEKKRINSKL